MRFWKRTGEGSFSFAAWTGKIRSAAPLAAGIVLTLLAVSVARHRITTLEREIRERNEPVEIVVASEDIPERGTLSGINLAKKSVPASGAGQRNIPAAEFTRILGTRVRGGIAAGEPVLWSDLEESGEAQRFSRSIPPGLRAVAVDADPLSSFAGLLRPGDRVDILHEREAGSGFLPLLRNVPVLAIDRRVRDWPGSEDPSEVSTITLSLLPAESLRFAHASRNGRMSFLLRNPDDRSSPSARSRRTGNGSHVEIWKAGIPAGRITVRGGAS